MEGPWPCRTVGRECLAAKEERRQTAGISGRRNSICKGLRAGTNESGISKMSDKAIKKKGTWREKVCKGPGAHLQGHWCFHTRSGIWSSSHLPWRPLPGALQNWDLQETGNPVLLTSPSATQARGEGDIWGIPLYKCTTLNLPQVTTPPGQGANHVLGSVPRSALGFTFKPHTTALLELWLIFQMENEALIWSSRLPTGIKKGTDWDLS